MRLRELVELGEVEEAEGDMEQVVTGLAYDSRQVKSGQVFFAVPGSRVDGQQYVRDAFRRGAIAVASGQTLAFPPEVTWIRVKDVRRTMGLWAASFFGFPSRQMALVGVTGTNGKTTITYLVESILAAAGMASGVIGTISYRYGGRSIPALQTTPESVDLQGLLAEMFASGVQAVAMEVSSHALSLERVRGIDFDVGVFTNLSRDHLDFHSDMEDYFAAKSRLFTDHLLASSKAKKAAVIHGGDPRGKMLLDKVRKLNIEALSFGLDPQWEIHPLQVQEDLEGLRGKIQIKDQILEFSSPLVGPANLENILGAVGVGFALGLSPTVIADGIARLRTVPGRLEKIENKTGIAVLVDYAHTPDALERALLALRPLTRGRLITVFGCGGDRDRGKRPLMGEIAARLSDWVVVTSDNPRTEEPLSIIAEIEKGVEKTALKKFSLSDFGFPISSPKSKIPNRKFARGYWVEPDRRKAIGLAVEVANPDDLVLIAGKGHEDYQILGTEKIHFDDREAASEELSRKRCSAMQGR